MTFYEWWAQRRTEWWGTELGESYPPILPNVAAEAWKAATAAERDRCAKIADGMGMQPAAEYIAAAIRSGGEGGRG